MDLLNRAYAQLYDLYRSMTPGSRLTAGLLAAVVIGSLSYLFNHQVSGPDSDLMHGVPIAASDLPRMEAAFGKANLKAYEVRGTSIRVPRGQESTYMAALAAENALPHDIGSALSEAVSPGNAWSDSGYGRQRDQRYKIALQAELSLIIGKMAGIESAYVLFDIDSKPGFNKDKLITATASVKPAGSSQLDETRVSSIRHFVAGNIAGLKPENVTVSDLNSGRTWYVNPDDGGNGEENLYLSLKRSYEEDLKTKILNALSFIPNVTVAPTVVLDRERITHFKQDKHSAAGKRRPGASASTPAKDSRAGRASTSPEQPNTATTILNTLLGGSRADDDAADADGSGPVADERVEKESVGLTPILARVSVGVPMSYFKKLWQEQNPAEPGRPPKTPDQAALDHIRNEVCANIQKHVAPLLPTADGAVKAADLVTVTPFQDLPVQEPPSPTFSDDALAWLRQSWEMLGLIVLALASLLVLRSMVRTRPAAAEVHSTPPSVDLSSEPDADRAAGIVPPPHARGFYQPELSPHDELSELVQNDPDAAANVLRNWIGQVG